MLITALVSLLISLVPRPLSPVPVVAGRVHYAAPDGGPRGNGTRERPWDLATALRGGGASGRRVEPGDTILLRGGTYRGPFRSTVSGSEGAPVVVRQSPGERAILNGAGTTSSTLAVRGAYSVFWGFELTNSDTVRASSRSSGVRPNVVVNYASHTKYVNLIVHDGGVAFYTEPSYVDVEIAGCIIYNNGWQGPTRGHGHALYLKSYQGPVLARDNVLFNQYGYGVHAYTNKGSGKLINITIEGNVAFNNGTLARQGPEANILVGGADYASGDIVRDNYTYMSPGLRGPNLKIGYGRLENGDVIVEGNYVVGGDPLIDVGSWSAARLVGNTLIGAGGFIRMNFPVSVGHVVRSNTERRRADTETTVVVRHNPYEAGRGHVIVYNWARRATAAADVSGILRVGDRFEVRNVQDLFGVPVASGRYAGGAISIPLGGVMPPAPTGLRRSPAPQTGPAFDVFIVTKVG